MLPTKWLCLYLLAACVIYGVCTFYTIKHNLFGALAELNAADYRPRGDTVTMRHEVWELGLGKIYSLMPDNDSKMNWDLAPDKVKPVHGRDLASPTYNLWSLPPGVGFQDIKLLERNDFKNVHSPVIIFRAKNRGKYGYETIFTVDHIKEMN